MNPILGKPVKVLDLQEATQEHEYWLFRAAEARTSPVQGIDPKTYDRLAHACERRIQELNGGLSIAHT